MTLTLTRGVLVLARSAAEARYHAGKLLRVACRARIAARCPSGVLVPSPCAVVALTLAHDVLLLAYRAGIALGLPESRL